MWYGVSNIISRMISAVITPLLTYLLGDNLAGMEDMGSFSMLYAAIALGNIIYTYGLETGYFRFVTLPDVKEKNLFNTSFTSLLITSTIFSVVLIIWKQPFSEWLAIAQFPNIVIMIAAIFWLDTMSAIPYARLRQQGRPMFYAFVKVTGVLIYLIFILFFLYVVPVWLKDIHNPFLDWIRAQNRVSLILLSNIFQSLSSLILLSKVYVDLRLKMDMRLWKRVLAYSLPMVLIGMAGMSNEVLDRFLLMSWLPLEEAEAKAQIGIYTANYKMGILIALFIQAFKLGAEPFFFNESVKDDAPKTYANVMKWFVITLCIAFLFSSLFFDILVMVNKGKYQTGKNIVPIVLLANVFLGIYYNLSVWYKITAKMFWGVAITTIGAIVTIVICYYYIPTYGIMAPAWATLICYAGMSIFAYLVGQKYYPIPYPVRRIFVYLLVSVVLFAVQQLIKAFWIPEGWQITYIISSGIVFIIIFLMFIMKKEEIPLTTVLTGISGAKSKIKSILGKKK